MVEVSKHLFESTCRDAECYLLLHYYERSCWKAIPLTFQKSLIGSAKFYSLVYLAQLLMRGKKLRKKETWMKMGEYYVRSTLMGALISASTSCIGCLLRWLLGNQFHYYTYVFAPNIINGLCIWLEPPSRRGLVVNLFSNLLIEYWLKTLQRDNYITLTLSKQTFMFMVGSALLFYLMRLEGDKEERTPLFWLFTPDKVKRKPNDDLKNDDNRDSQNVCPHEGPCISYILKGTSTYFGIGAAIQLARLLLPRINTPIKALSSVRGKHFKMALFFGGYIGIYRAVICYLCRKRGLDSALYALPAGYLAGLSFLFNPNLGISIASLTGAFKLFATTLYEKNLLPASIPLPEMLFMFSQATLYHARFMHADVCPSYVVNLMKTVSSGCSDQLQANMMKEVMKVL